jgi:hypothetical protein
VICEGFATSKIRIWLANATAPYNGFLMDQEQFIASAIEWKYLGNEQNHI